MNTRSALARSSKHLTLSLSEFTILDSTLAFGSRIRLTHTDVDHGGQWAGKHMCRGASASRWNTMAATLVRQGPGFFAMLSTVAVAIRSHYCLLLSAHYRTLAARIKTLWLSHSLAPSAGALALLRLDLEPLVSLSSGTPQA